MSGWYPTKMSASHTCSTNLEIKKFLIYEKKSDDNYLSYGKYTCHISEYIPCNTEKTQAFDMW